MSLLGRAARPVLRRIDQRIDRKMRQEFGNYRQELRWLREQQHLTELLLGNEGRRAHRMPQREEVDELARQVAEMTGERFARRSVIQAYRTVVEVENRGIGRIAGETGNVLAKLAATPMLRPPNGDVLEIGTLYGLFACCLGRHLTRFGLSCHLTIVDPIAPAQLQEGWESTHDASGTPINEDIVRANLHSAGILPDQVRLLRGYSTDEDIRRALAGGKFGVIVVDGDHSAPGVKADLEWAEEVAAPGAVIVVDDYGDAGWPGVREATDAHLAEGGTRLTKIAHVATSAFLRAA